MKKILTILLILILNQSYGQNVLSEVFPLVSGKIEYQEVVLVDSTIKPSVIYLGLKEWVVKTFVSSKDVIQTDDQNNFTLLIKSFIPKNHTGLAQNGKNWYLLKIEAKQGKFRYTMNDFNYEYDLKFNDYSEHHSDNLEKWIAYMSTNLNERRYENLKKHCSELNSGFTSTLESLKKIKFDSGIKSDW